MVQRTQVILEDDVDGGPASETVTFALDGATYEIELNTLNAAALREAMAPFVGRARRSGGRRSTARRKSRVSKSGEIRAWARAHGYEVSDRGRVSGEVQEAYEISTR